MRIGSSHPSFKYRGYETAKNVRALTPLILILRGLIATADGEAAQRAIARIKALTAEAEIGETYLGTVSRIVDFGAFVEIMPGLDGLLHISEISDRRVRDVRDELKEGQQILVKCIGKEGNKIKLSRKAILMEEKAKAKGGEE